MFEYILKGMVVGIIVTAPVGPIGLLCIQRTINRGMLSGLVTGVSSAIADIMFAIIAGFSISAIGDFMEVNKLIIRLIGGIIVLILGIRIYMINPVKRFRHTKPQKRSYFSDAISGFLITLTNPIVIIVFGAAFAGLGLNEAQENKEVILTITGIFIGATAWWTSLTSLVNIFKAKINLRKMFWINRITGILVVLFGIAIIIGSLFIKKF
ncbi:MAG: LysE family translocator [Bacteroidales bacterium]|nr:LysE family translocator [Bacteroidales bacterium]